MGYSSNDNLSNDYLKVVGYSRKYLEKAREIRAYSVSIPKFYEEHGNLIGLQDLPAKKLLEQILSEEINPDEAMESRQRQKDEQLQSLCRGRRDSRSIRKSSKAPLHNRKYKSF